MAKQKSSTTKNNKNVRFILILLTVFLGLVLLGYLYKEKYLSKKLNNNYQAALPIDENRLALGKILPVDLPSGWEKTSDAQLRKKLNGVTYRVGLQLNDAEYLEKDGAYARDLDLLDVVKTKKGTDVYIVKESSGYIYASACKPKKDEACSIPFGNQLLFIMLNTDVPGSQYPVELNFTNPGIETVFAEFAQIIKSSNF